MDWWTFSGTGCLGLTIGWLVIEFTRRSKTLGLKAISTLASIVSGGLALGVWRVSQEHALPREANAYFIGVFLSVLVLGLLQYEPRDEVSR
jgi:hypothetical protein